MEVIRSVEDKHLEIIKKMNEQIDDIKKKTAAEINEAMNRNWIVRPKSLTSR
jgi:hypothetical protein